MTNMRLRAIRAKHGDCLLLFAKGSTILIDGGPPGVFNNFLRDQLEALPDDGEEPPVIDLMIVSHEDRDHIAGIIDLTEDLIDSDQTFARPLVSIRRAWHNSFADSIVKAGISDTLTAKKSALQAASVFSELISDLDGPEESKLILSSVNEGRTLRNNIKTLAIPHNMRFKDQLVFQENSESPWINGNLSVEVIGPTSDELDDLREKWIKALPKLLDKEAKAKARLAAGKSLDTSITNLASIVAIAESGGKTTLLTGDARADMIYKWLDGKDKLNEKGGAHFNIIKLGHHGSIGNSTKEFFEKITADHYVISGNGGHGNPNPDTLDLLFNARPGLNYKIHLTYSPDELKQNNTYIEKGHDVLLDTVLKDKKRRDILNFPRLDKDFIDIII